MEAPKWEFVNFDKPVKEQGDASQKQVRSGAMRAFRRKERLRRVETFQKTKQSLLILANDRLCSEEVGGERLYKTARLKALNQGEMADPTQRPGEAGALRSGDSLGMRLPSPTPSFLPPDPLPVDQEEDEIIRQHTLKLSQDLTDLSSLDPCCTQALGLRPHQHYLLNHFLSVMAPRPFRFATKKEQNPIGSPWIHEVLQDGIMLEATFFNASVHLDRLHEREPSLVTLLHRGKTIQMVNQTLCSPERVSDSVIAAVVLMAWSGNYNSNLAEIRIHLDALVTLVRLRGGLEALGFGGILHMLITRLDFIYATWTMSAPKFPFLGDEIHSDNSDCATSNPPHAASHLLERIPEPLPAIFLEIRSLMTMQDGASTNEVPKDLGVFAMKRSLIYHKLLSCSEQQDSSENDTCSGHLSLFEPCRIASFIFIEYILAGRRPNREIMQALESKLRSSLQSVLEWDIQRAQPLVNDPLCEKVILWVHFIGGLASSSALNRQWYEARISQSVVSLGLRDWKEFRTCLSEMVLWQADTHDPAEELWHGFRNHEMGHELRLDE